MGKIKFNSKYHNIEGISAKEKAKDLIMKYSFMPDGNNELVRKAAILCVNEIISSMVLNSTEKNYWERVIIYIKLYGKKENKV